MCLHLGRLSPLFLFFLLACQGGNAGHDRELVIAAATNLMGAFDEIARRFEQEHQVKVVLSYGATGSLAQQISHGAPFDLFAAADVVTIDRLVRENRLRPESRRIYARGRLVLWWPQSDQRMVRQLNDLTSPAIKRIALAKPDLAPYGAAAQAALMQSGLWSAIESKVVFAENVSQAKQYAATGNADLAFIPLALAQSGGGRLDLDPSLYQPIDQAIGILNRSPRPELAVRFIEYLTGAAGQAILRRHGYELPQP